MLKNLENMPIEQLEKYKLEKFHYWTGNWVGGIGMSYTDGQHLGYFPWSLNATFTDIAKVKKVKQTFHKGEQVITRLQFYSGDGRELLKIGSDVGAGREETFHIATDEELLGCELHKSVDCRIFGITWLKWRRPRNLE